MKGTRTYQIITAGILMAAFLAQTLSNHFIIAEYYANTAKYEKNCENKARPQLKCHGKCQMMKKLKQETNKDKENPERKTGSKYEILISSKSFFSVGPTLAPGIPQPKKLCPRTDGSCTDRSLDIFHPPQVC